MSRFPIAVLLLIAIGRLQAQPHWQSTNGPHAGSISLIYTLSTGEIFASDPNSYVYRSSDRGDHWTPVINEGATEIVEAPNGDIYAGCGPVLGDVFRSTDRGITWTRIPFLDEFPDRPRVRRIAITPKGTIFLRTWSDVFFRSRDRGATWQQMLEDSNGFLRYTPDIDNTDDWGVACDSSGAIYFPSYNHMFRSTNDGDTWRDTIISCFIGNLSMLPSGDGYSEGIEHLFPGGDTCNRLKLPPGGVAGAPWVGRDHSLLIYFVTNRNAQFGTVAFSTDTGKTFTVCDSFASRSVNYLMTDSAGNMYAGMDMLGVYRSTNRGKRWNAVNNGITGAQQFVLAANAHNEVIASNGASLFYSSDKGDNWTEIERANYAQTGDNPIAIDPGGTIIVSKDTSVFTSSDRGSHWARSAGIHEKIASYIFDSVGNAFASNGAGAIYRSSDRGAHWQALSLPKSITAVGSLGVDSGNTIYVGTRNHGVWRSTDHGDTWTMAGSRMFDSVIDVQVVTPDGVLIATPEVSRYKGYYRSANHGDYWTFIAGNFVTPPFVHRTIYDYSGGLITISEDPLGGTDDTLYRSIDSGLTWHIMPNMSIDFPIAFTIPLLATPDGILYSANSHEVLRTAESLRASTREQPASDISASIYPNPVESVLHFDGALGGTVDILDILGRTLIETSSNGDINVAGLSGGTYFARLIIRGHLTTIPFWKRP